MRNSNNEQNSRFKFLWIDIVFRKEEKGWYRLVVIILSLVAIVFVLWMLKEIDAPAIGIEKLSHFKASWVSLS